MGGYQKRSNQGGDPSTQKLHSHASLESSEANKKKRLGSGNCHNAADDSSRPSAIVSSRPWPAGCSEAAALATPHHLLMLHEDVLLLIIRRAISDSPCPEDVLLVCKRFRDLLLANATSVTVTSNNPTLLQHCRTLRAMTLAGCSRLPWELEVRDGVPCCSPSHLTSLERIDAGNAHVWSWEMEKLHCLPKLKHLRVSKNVLDPALAQLAGMTALRSLDLSTCSRLTPACLQYLSHLTLLESLDVSDSSLPVNECLVHITGLTALTKLEFGPKQRDWSASGACGFVTDAGLAALASLTALRTLNLHGAVVGTGEALLLLSALCCLEFLDLGRNDRLLEKNKAFLPFLTRLHTLDMTCVLPDYNLEGVVAHVARLRNLQTLEFSDDRLNDKNMAHFSNLTGITHLELAQCIGITENGFACLRCMSSLQTLAVSTDSPVPFAVMALHLAHLPSLRGLGVGDIADNFSDENFAQLATLTQLTGIELDYLRPEAVHGMRHLSTLRSLKRLDIEECDLDLNRALPHVARLTSLDELYLDKHYVPALTDDALAYLSTLRKLKDLELERCTLLTNRGAATLSQLHGLTFLRLSGCAGVSRLMLPSSLRVLDITDCPAIGDNSLAAVGSLQHLEYLQLAGGPRVTDAGLALLRDATTLTELSLHGCKEVTWEGLEQLSPLRALKVLDLSGCHQLDARAMAALSCHRALTHLILNCTRVRDDGLLHLTQLRRLQQLDLAGVPLTVNGLAHVGRISTLKELDLSDCPRISNGSLDHLTSLVHLEHLHVDPSLAFWAGTLVQVHGLWNLRIN